MIEPDHSRLSIVRQCRLVSIARSSHYYAGKGERPLSLALMRFTCDDRGTASVASGFVA